MASGGIKRATGVVGYAVVPNAREVLCNLYAKTVAVLQRLPKDVAYRKHTEQIVQQRLQIVQSETSIPSIEEKIGCGQVEELIDQVPSPLVYRPSFAQCTSKGKRYSLCSSPTAREAERELSLAGKMEEWQPWEPLVAEPPPNQWKWP